ncbi:MAG: hypothetical protein IJD22_07160, partial [Clostridia bacterium]|nr:hypothetical protein [Clostridia bacterium]
REPGAYIVRWVPALSSVIAASLLVFNLAMPAKAEQIPLVGKAFARLNTVGKNARENGKTPEFLIPSSEEDEGFSLSVSLAECNGLDLVVRLEVEDKNNTVTDRSEILTVTNCAVEIEGNLIYPTDENPRLTKTSERIYSGLATFNSSSLAAFLPHNGKISATVYCEGLSSYVEGATYEEVTSLYSYSFEYAKEFTVYTDLSALEIERLDMEKNGVQLEYFITSGDRTDIVYSVDETVEYAKSFSVFTDKGEPRLVSGGAVMQDGRYVYNAVFSDRDDGSIILPESECLDGIVGDGSEIIVYSHATGEYILFETESEAE